LKIAREPVFTIPSLDLLMDCIIDHSVGATVILGKDGVILRASPAVKDLFLENPTGIHFTEAFPLTLVDPEQPPETSAVPGSFSIQDVLEGTVFNGLEAYMIRSDGTTLSLMLAARSLMPFGDEFKGAVVTLLDLTPRRKAELQSLVRNQQLRFHLELTKTITDNTSEALFLTDLEGRIQFVNPAAEKLIDWTAEDLVGKVLHHIVHPRHDPEEKPIGSCGLGRPAETVRQEVAEDVFMRKDGNSVFVRYSLAPVISNGRMTGTVYGVGDISGRKQSEEALHASEEKLRQSQKMEAIGRLAGGIAHDFNNLLTAINGYATLGLEVLDPGETLYDYLEEIKKSGERAASLTSQLLSYSRKQVLASQYIDLNSIVRDTVAITERTLGENLTFRIGLHPEACMVNVDPIRIQQVLVNLAINSRDAMPKGGVLRMETGPLVVAEMDRSGLMGETKEDAYAGLPPGDYVRFSIIDDGQGMDDSVKAHLFEPFFTTKGVGKGTGLGLSMAYGIVKQHRGHIQVYSEVGKGTTVNILFPAASRGKAAVPVEPLRDASSRGTETVLLVEDEAVVLGLMQKVLSGSGYKVLEAHDGAQALQISDAYPEKIHLLITDVVMNGIGGYELAEAFNIRRPGVPRIFISGYNENSILRREIRDERAVFLQKPFSPAAFMRLIRKTLDQERASA